MEKIKLQIEEYFKGLEFNEGAHIYSYDSKPLSISVSGLIKDYYKEFDAYSISASIAKRDGVTQESVLAEWKEAADLGCSIGNKTHLFGEYFPWDKTLEPTTGYEEAVTKFWDDLPPHIIPMSMEQRMFHKEYMFAGTADILLYNTKTGEVIIADYKTNKDLFKNFKNQKMLAPFQDLLDCGFSKYRLQLSYYQLLLEQAGVKVSSRVLIWLLPNGEYEMYDLEDYTEVLKKELKIKYSKNV